jgi:hypothetical protein
MASIQTSAAFSSGIVDSQGEEAGRYTSRERELLDSYQTAESQFPGGLRMQRAQKSAGPLGNLGTRNRSRFLRNR